jgi:hypothetical protein
MILKRMIYELPMERGGLPPGTVLAGAQKRMRHRQLVLGFLSDQMTD